MGNCATCSSKSTAEIAPHDFSKSIPSTTSATRPKTSTPAIQLHAFPNSAFSLFFQYALRLKSLPLQLIASAENSLRIGDDPVGGSRESLLRVLDEKFPSPHYPRLVPTDGNYYRNEGSLLLLLQEGETAPLVVRLVALQHRSMTWHLERIVRLVEDLRPPRGGGGKNLNPSVGNAKMEVRKFGESYNMLLEVLLEHAQMEERVVFPILEAADPGLCRTANEEHGRDLPTMNGIKEVIKSVVVLDIGSPDYQEALSDLLTRLKSLQKRCKDHFEEEQRNVLPLMEAVGLSKEQQQKVAERCLDSMQGTHSRLFNFLVEGLFPWEAMLYLDMIIRCKEEEQAVSMLRRIVVE